MTEDERGKAIGIRNSTGTPPLAFLPPSAPAVGAVGLYSGLEIPIFVALIDHQR